ncbi:GRIP1-associated protein 1-like isoform X1 [Pocillopora damicornis]|uniref:GRIP1-associated protein 1-like isoform X1 n=1 Tax=Pocillopora damicornis TaxID=46731 RepID=UPI000F553C92|nr:GRIP1-associated protein 1-like isoform X1 [Pocillopora damicornis]
MAQSLSDEEFSRMQTQLIELRTLNYELESNCQRQQTELGQLQEKYNNQEKELQKANKIINKSKNRKEYAVLLEENENLQRQFQAQEENFKLQNQTLLEEISKLNDDNEKLQRQVTTKDGGQDSGSDAELRRLRAENAALQKSLTNSQQRHEDELMQLQEKLQSLSDDHDNDSCQSPDAGENDAEELPANGETHGDENKDAVNESGQAKTSRQKLHEILNVELSVFCEKMCSSKTGDVSKEAETNQRHEVAKDVDENLSVVDGAETESNAPGTAMFDSTDKKSGNEDFIEEIDNLKRKLADSLFHFVSSNEVTAAVVRSPPRERRQEVEVRSLALEKQVKEMASLQLQLDTEREEKRILQDQLHEAETSGKQEISKLEKELSQLTEKVKRKQESYLQLQEEKEKLYSENKKSQEELKTAKEHEIEVLTEQMAKLQDEVNTANQRYTELKEGNERKIKGLEETMTSQRNQASLSAEETEQVVAGLRQENASLVTEVQELRAKVKTIREEQEESEDLISQLENKVSLTETRCAELAMEVDELTAHVKEQNTAVEGWNEQISQLTSERDQLKDSLEEVTKVAKSRKELVDTMAIEKQTTDANHKEQLDKLQEDYKKEINELRELLTGEKKLRKEVEDSQQKLAETKAKLQSVESKSGWFERRLAETEENLKAEKERNEQTLANLQAERDEELKSLQEERERGEEGFQSQISGLQEEMEEKEQEMEKLRHELKDKEVENKIAGKKGDQLVKDLKRQLKLERKRGEQLQQKLQEALSENRVKPAFEDMFVGREHQRRNSGDSSIVSQPSRSEVDSPEFRPPSPAASMISMLNDDTTDLIERLADVQQDKWLLEEKVRHLEENGAALADDLLKKSAIIQAYAMETKVGPIAESPAKSSPAASISTLKEKIRSPFGKAKPENTRKIQLMLEETLTKNIQLQRDVDSMSKELQRFKQQEVIPPELNETSDSVLDSSLWKATEEEESELS